MKKILTNNNKIQILIIALVLSQYSQVSGQEYIGCFIDEQTRDLEHSAGTGFTVDMCYEYCLEKGYLYSATQFGEHCYCSDSYGQYGQAPQVECDTACIYNNEEICGGFWRNSVYENTVYQNNGQFCYQHLATLTENSVTNECEPVTTENNYIVYDFHIDYVLPYVFDPNCLVQAVTFEEHTILEAQNQENWGEWKWKREDQRTSFSIAHSDIEAAGCSKQETPEEYIWQCEMALHIYYNGYEQFTYSFFMTSVLSRVYENQLTVQVKKNQVVGDCCENRLNIFTKLQFCEDFSCSAYLPDNQIVKRKQDIFLEHSIVTPEFQYYYLHGLQIKLGQFVPVILAIDGSQPGKVRYHIQSNIAQTTMVIEAISRIDETPMRRFLVNQNQKQDLGSDYKIKAQNYLQVLEELVNEDNLKEANDAKNKSDKEIEKNTSYLIILFISLSVGFLIIFGGIGFYCIRKNIIKARLQDNDSSEASSMTRTLASRRQSEKLAAPLNIDSYGNIQLQQSQPQISIPMGSSAPVQIRKNNINLKVTDIDINMNASDQVKVIKKLSITANKSAEKEQAKLENPNEENNKYDFQTGDENVKITEMENEEDMNEDDVEERSNNNTLEKYQQEKKSSIIPSVNMLPKIMQRVLSYASPTKQSSDYPQFPYQNDSNHNNQDSKKQKNFNRQYSEHNINNSLQGNLNYKKQNFKVKLNSTNNIDKINLEQSQKQQQENYQYQHLSNDTPQNNNNPSNINNNSDLNIQSDRSSPLQNRKKMSNFAQKSSDSDFQDVIMMGSKEFHRKQITDKSNNNNVNISRGSQQQQSKLIGDHQEIDSLQSSLESKRKMEKREKEDNNQKKIEKNSNINDSFSDIEQADSFEQGKGYQIQSSNFK